MILVERKVGHEWQVVFEHWNSHKLTKVIEKEVNMLRDRFGAADVRCRHMPGGKVLYVPAKVEKFPYHVQQGNGRWVFKMLTREHAAKLIAKSMGLDV